MTATEIPVDNGVNVEALLGVRNALGDTPEIAQFQWRSTVSWVNGTHSRSDVETFYGFGDEQQHHTTFSYDVDHPLQFAAQDNGVTPVEYVLVALGSCLTAGVAAVAQQRSIQLRSVRATLAAEMDLHGILGADPDVRNGFSGVIGQLPDRRRRHRRGDQGAGRAVAEALRGLRHRHQPDQRHRRRHLIGPDKQGRRSRAGYHHCDRRGRPLRAGHEPLPRRPFGRPRRPRTRTGRELVAHAAVGLAAAAHPELDDPAARLRVPRRRPGRLPQRPAGHGDARGLRRSIRGAGA